MYAPGATEPALNTTDALCMGCGRPMFWMGMSPMYHAECWEKREAEKEATRKKRAEWNEYVSTDAAQRQEES